ncbi:hypothetical protein [Clostridium sp. HBUAS56017]|uniref:hypothetical protein n=1 Tax=Clostridium sp. HBUAS56017 TaxID=2571128 RepID=UPI001178BAB6|nr:hypothetical protein [Clostridium sp. HBUAS56017]
MSLSGKIYFGDEANEIPPIISYRKNGNVYIYSLRELIVKDMFGNDIGLTDDELEFFQKIDPKYLGKYKQYSYERIFTDEIPVLKGIVDVSGLRGISNATIWEDIVGTARNMPGTEIPATFQVKLREGISYTNSTTGSNVLWTNANATEHMGEYVSRFGTESESIGIRSQEMLESYSASLNEAMADLAKKAPGRYFETYGNWELGINTETGVVYHAKMLK